MKRYLSFLLCLAMLLGLLPMLSVAADDANVISEVRLSVPWELFDGSGRLLPTGRVADLNPVCETEGVLAEPVRWYCGGIPMEIPDSAMRSFTAYRVLIRLQAEGDGIFTEDTQVELLNGFQPVQSISPDGKTAYVLSRSIMTACHHPGAELRSDLSAHWMECPLCCSSYELSQHQWDEGEEQGEEIHYTCSVCALEKTEPAGKKQLYKAEIRAVPALLGETIPEPVLENDGDFRVVSYQWYKDGTLDAHKAAAGDTFAEGDYYLRITVRVRNAGKNYITDNSYISTAGAWDEISCTVDKDAGAITALFSVPVYSITPTNITLPTVSAGASIPDSLKACKVTSEKCAVDLTSVMVYENGEFLGLYAETGLGFSTWTGENGIFQAGKVYTLVGTASFDGWYTDSFYITVENPGICADLDVEGTAESLGFRATYLCAKEPDILCVAVSGIEDPVAGTTPGTKKLKSEAPSLYSAKLTAWKENEEAVTVFEEGHSYQAIVAVTPEDAAGLDQDTAPLLPVIIDGQLGEYLGIGEAGAFLYGAKFLCVSAPHTHDYKAAVTPPTCTEAGFTTYLCDCGDAYQDDETDSLGHAWDEGTITIFPTEHRKGEITYICTRCGESKTEILQELGHEHSYHPTVTEPTCEAGGYTTYTCECGDSYIADETQALGCDYETVVVAPTCTEQGFSTQRCRRCGITVPIMEDFVDALGHDYANGICTRCGEADPNPGCPSKIFTDVPGEDHWAHKGIDYAVANGLMKGVADSKFNPGGTLTRAELVTILYREAGSPEVEYQGIFADVAEGQWYTAAVEWAATNKIVNGVGDGTNFAPSATITREQIATILYRYSGSPAIEGDLKAFPDSTKVSSFATAAMVWAVENKIITGASVGGVTYINPLNSATREQIASIIMRYLEA